MHILYTDDYILAGPDEKEPIKIVDDIKESGLDTKEGDTKDFLEINIDKVGSDTYHMS